MTAEPDGLDPERRLALAYVGASRGPALATLWRLDGVLGNMIGASSQPAVAQIKLAWWREALIRLDENPAPAEPLLQAIEGLLIPAGIAGHELAVLADGWEYLVVPDTLSADDLDAYATARGGVLFDLSAKVLGMAPFGDLASAGKGWALVDLARHSRKKPETMLALKAAADCFARAPRRWPGALRPLGMLTVLARRDAASPEKGLAAAGSPGRMLRMLVHRLTGR